MSSEKNRILVTGGGTFMGNHIAAALLTEGADVRLLVRRGAEPLLGNLANEVTWWHGDAWNPASMKGRGRGSMMVIHTVGGMQDDPAQGLTFHYLNFLSLRNVANMCVTDGVPHLMLISAASAPWLPRQYIRSKREAETYIARVGLRGTIIRAPLLYRRGQPRPFAYRIISLAMLLNPFGQRIAPMPVDIFSRGVARIAMSGGGRKIYYAGDLRRLNTREERRGQAYGTATPTLPRTPVFIDEPTLEDDDTRPNAPVRLP